MSAAFAQFVVGPPGSGKSTYCAGMKAFMNGMHRATAVVNLDPANEAAMADIDIRQLVVVDDVMERRWLETEPLGHAACVCNVQLVNGVDRPLRR